MNKIDLQNKTKIKNGVIEIFQFEDENSGIKKTTFHRMFIPLELVNSTSENSTIEQTEIAIDWLDLNLKSVINLDGLNLKTTPKDSSQVSIYLDNIHIPCDIDKMIIKKIGDNLYDIDCQLFIDFEHEKIAPNEVFTFITQMALDTNIQE